MRKSDPRHCNKCGAPLTSGGFCEASHVAVVKHRVLQTERIGQTHVGRLSAPVVIHRDCNDAA
jgi:hypothetical protein